MPGLKIGTVGVNHPAQLNEDIGRLHGKGVKVFALADDLEERGISEGNCISEAKMIRGRDVADLMDNYQQVWHW
ncbi:MAG TPA: hypothetical protein VGJ55_04870 [Pyrinomonadaceae bacterium]|jgi:sulfur transfer complex TusBCD TusB component (DsrH family)